MNREPGARDVKDAGREVPALATDETSAQASRCGKGERRKMAWLMKLLGFGPADGDSPDKNFRKGEFTPEAAKARDAFLENKKQNPQVKTPEEMAPIGRRMQSGSI